jgi:lysophospholipase L1-like esterase
MLGINNMWPGWSADDTIKGLETVIAAIRAKLPQTKIALLGVLPIWDKGDPIRAKIKKINAGIAPLDDGKTLRFFDFGDKFLTPDGSLGEGLFQKDRLHLTPAAYRIYADALDPLLREMLK